MNIASRSFSTGATALLALICLFAATAARSGSTETSASILSEGDVLASSANHYPSILEQLAQLRGAEGKLTEAEGAFDLVFSSEGFSRVSGYYDGTVVRGGMKQNLPALGSSVYADYRISNGDFPLYEDSGYTNRLGEMKLGAIFSLLRDRQIDDRRFERIDAQLSAREASLDLALTQIGVQRRALIAYWRWVTAGRALEVYENLLMIARERQAGLEEQVRRGAQAEIFLIENQQNITRRETFVMNARRELLLAANELSLYYRGDRGMPVVPSPQRLPQAGPVGVVDDLTLSNPADTVSALARRPELALLKTAFERSQNRLELARNLVKPRVDFSVELARDFGEIAEGGISRDGTDAIVGVSFSMPLQQRTARGRIRQEMAQLEAIQQQQRLREDQIAVELENIVVDLNAAAALLQLAADQVEQTEMVREAEQRRFENGASDFFVVNLREETAANARIQYHVADLERHIARANYDAAVVDMERLGLDDSLE